MPEFKIVKEGKNYIVRDAKNGTDYGKYDTKEEAEVALNLWKGYYSE